MQELERSKRMLRNTWESQNARAAHLQDAAFELESELGAMRVQYAAAVASLQVHSSLLSFCNCLCLPLRTGAHDCSRQSIRHASCHRCVL